jgi:hypothetical protein
MWEVKKQEGFVVDGEAGVRKEKGAQPFRAQSKHVWLCRLAKLGG